MEKIPRQTSRVDSEAPRSHALFPTTQWSAVLSAGIRDNAAAGEAMTQLCRAYWPPLYAFARRSGLALHDAQDLVQGFIAHLLAREGLAGVAPHKGRFRSFLLTGLRNFQTSQARAQLAQKRGGNSETISLDFQNAETLCAPELTDHLSPDRAFDRHWARTVMRRALDRLAAEYRQPRQQKLFTALRPVLMDGGRVQGEATLAAELGLSPGALAVAATRLRQRYRALLEDEVAQTLGDTGDLAEELRALREAWL